MTSTDVRPRCRPVLLALAALLAGVVAGAGPAGAADPAVTDDFRLSDKCPRHFSPDASGACRFQGPVQSREHPPGHRGLVKPLPPARDGYTAQQIDLGRLLFFEPALSADGRSSCAHCHHPDHGWSDGLGRSRGRGATGAGPERAGGVELPRGAPTLWNVGFLPRLFWDGRARTLEQQATGPLFAPDEMAATPAGLEAVLNGNAIWRRLFGEAFGLAADARITTGLVLEALVAFQGTLVSFDSRYDRYMAGHDAAFDAREHRGYELFHSFRTRCAHCHAPPLFTDGEVVAIGVPEPPGKAFDPGAAGVSGDSTLHGAFRTPTVRNVLRTSPYMHSGAHVSLADAVRFYSEPPGSKIPPGEHVLLHWLMIEGAPTLSDTEIDDLVAFMGALTDETSMPRIPERVPSGLPVVPHRPPCECKAGQER